MKQPEKLLSALKFRPSEKSGMSLMGMGVRTLHKYLSQWKTELLDLAAKLHDGGTLELDNLGTSAEEKLALEKVVREQGTQNKILAAELIKCEIYTIFNVLQVDFQTFVYFILRFQINH